MYHVFEIACYMLQKLCYYIQAWSLAVLGKGMADTKFEAWVHGPVSRPLFDFCKDGICSLNTITHNISDDDKDFINLVLDMYGKLTGIELEELSKGDVPWIEARKGLEFWEQSKNYICEDLMASHYRDMLKNTLHS